MKSRAKSDKPARKRGSVSIVNQDNAGIVNQDNAGISRKSGKSRGRTKSKK